MRPISNGTRIALSTRDRHVRPLQQSTGGVMKPNRYPRGLVSLREIRRYQKSVDLLLPIAPFQRLVREIAQNLGMDVRFKPTALTAIQEAVENYIVELFNDCVYNCIHADRVTVLPEDLKLAVRYMRKNCNLSRKQTR